MAVGINSYNSFLAQLARRAGERDINAFLLFDEGQDCIVVEDYLQEKNTFAFLDGLADQSGSFIYVFTERRFESPEDDRMVFNPGPKVAGLFGIPPNEMPGILFFTARDTVMNVQSAIYFQFNLDSIEEEEDEEGFEALLRELFSAVLRANQAGDTPEQKLSLLEKEIDELKRKESLEPVMAALKAGAQNVAKLPMTLLTEMAKTLGAALAKNITG